MSTSPATPAPAPKPRGRWKKIAATVLTSILVLWLGFVGFIWHVMYEPPEDFAQVMKHMPWEVFLVVPFETLWTRARAGSLHIGDAAPNFSLLKLDKTATIHLSELNQKQPVVMVFGSYT